MIKYILRLSIAAFITIFTYDTINFYLSRTNVPQENQLVVVRPVVKAIEVKNELKESLGYDLKDNPLWYIGLGAATATGVAIFCYCISAASSKTKLTKEPKGQAEDDRREVKEDSGLQPMMNPKSTIDVHRCTVINPDESSTTVITDDESSPTEINAGGSSTVINADLSPTVVNLDGPSPAAFNLDGSSPTAFNLDGSSPILINTNGSSPSVIKADKSSPNANNLDTSPDARNANDSSSLLSNVDPSESNNDRFSPTASNFIRSPTASNVIRSPASNIQFPHTVSNMALSVKQPANISMKDISEENEECAEEDVGVMKAIAENSQDLTDFILGASEEGGLRSESIIASDYEQTSTIVPVKPTFGDYLQVVGNYKEKSFKIAESELADEEPTKLYDDSDIILESKIIMESELSRKALPNDLAVVSFPPHIIAAMSCMHVNKSEPDFSSLPLTKGDLEKIEIRLSNIEDRVTKMEAMSKDCTKQLEIAESELVELHEQMYTILTKLEEERKPSYIIVSQMSVLDDDMKDGALKGVILPKPEPKKVEYHQEQGNTVAERKSKKKEKSQKVKAIMNEEENIPKPEDTTEGSGLLSKERPSSGGGFKSVGLDAILVKEIPPKSSTAPPRKANPKVPTHYVQPYRRSSFTATDSLSDIRRVTLRLMRARNDKFR